MPRHTRTAYVTDCFSAYDNTTPQPIRISRSKARCAGADGVQFQAPGWRAMAFRSMEAAASKIERHPGFCGWTV
jgi:hypothetical protein